MTMFLFVVGLALLTLGAEVLVRGAATLARLAGLPSLIIGLTVVAYGTSAPELAVSVNAGMAGQGDIALGNVVGSNIFNVLFILGLSALIVPLTASAQLIRMDVPIMVGISGLVWMIAADGNVSRAEGALLLIGLVAYTGLLIYLGTRERPTRADDDPPLPRGLQPLITSAIFILAGLAMLVLGARWLVQGAVDIARVLGLGELMISLTVVAAGTSMPEVATSIVASIRGQRDIALGNVVGSNIFNLLGVLGAAGLVGSEGVSVAPEALRFDIPVMVAVALACLPIFFTGGRISRGEGVLLLGYYVAYITFLALAATKHAALETFSTAVLWFAIPLTVIGIGISLVQSRRRRPR